MKLKLFGFVVLLEFLFVVNTFSREPAFHFKRELFGRRSTLNARVQEIDRATGLVSINGGDSARPTTPFTFSWGDGQSTKGFFPQKHTYADPRKNYLVTITAHYGGGRTDTTEVLVRFVPPRISRVSLPANISVSIPSQLVKLESRMPGYSPSKNLTFFPENFFQSIPRSTVEHVLRVAATIQMELANEDVLTPGGRFDQALLRDPKFGGMYSLWYTTPISFGVGNYGFKEPFAYSSFFHEMGHNVTLNSPARYHYGGRIDGNANAIYSETLAQIFQHATAYEIVNNYARFGLEDALAAEIGISAKKSMKIVRDSYERYIREGRNYCSWNDPRTLKKDETFDTFMTIAYKFFEQAETRRAGYRIGAKRMMTLLQTFDGDMRKRYSRNKNTREAEAFRANLFVAALSYAFSRDLREDFRKLRFPVRDKVYEELMEKVNQATR